MQNIAGEAKKTTADMAVKLGPVRLQNPVLTASGTCGYAFELSDFVDLGRIGGFITKSITLEPRDGNPPQRTVETAGGMLNSIGLANIGLERFCRERVTLLARMTVPVFVNVAGKTIEEYTAVAARLGQVDTISGLELNISCPNVKQGGMAFGTDPLQVEKLVAAVRSQCPKTMLIVKLTPNVTDITATAKAAIEAGADALSLINTFSAMAIDIESRKPILGQRTGGLSGPAIKPIAVYMVHRVYQEVAKPAGIPIIGMGGICCGTDALEFIIAGATAVCIGTAAMINPACLTAIPADIEKYLLKHNISSVSKLTGSL